MTMLATNDYRDEHDIDYYDPDWLGSGDLAYRQERCKLDIYYPVQNIEFVTVVYFHGGGLQGYEKAFPDVFRNQSIAVVAPNYRLSSTRAQCPDYLEDAAAAVAWVFHNISRYGGDPSKIYISGGSAGGYLATMIGMVPAYLAKHGISNQQLAGLMPVSSQMTTHFQVVNERRGIVSFTSQPVPVIDEYAPLFHIHKNIPPVVLLTGDPAIEMPGRPEENKLLATLLTRVAGHSQVECITLSGYDHGDIYNPACLLILKKIQEMELRKFSANGSHCEPWKIMKTALPANGNCTAGIDWSNADWRTLVSRNGQPFLPSTVAAFMYDDENLYFKVIGDEPAPDKMVQKYFGDDSPCLWEGDCVELYLATAQDDLSKAYQFVVAPDGSVYDAEIAAFGASGGCWNLSGLKVSSRIENGRWTVEMIMPIADLGVRPAADIIKGNVYRHRMANGDDRTANWSPTLVSRNYIPELFGSIMFIL